MKDIVFIIAPLAVLCLTATGYAQPGSVNSSDSLPLDITQGFIVGADISWVQAAEDRGVKFSENGTEKDILGILRDHGPSQKRIRSCMNFPIARALGLSFGSQPPTTMAKPFLTGEVL